MELPNIGQNCSDLNCKQLDFLPFKCKCGLIYCSDHFNTHALECPAVQVHNEPNLEIVKATVCAHPSCKNKSYVLLLCSECGEFFCVTHRHVTECKSKSPEVVAAELEKFNAPAKKFEEAKLEVDKMLDKNILEAKKKPKTQQMANKLQLMRIKGKATGLKSIPTTDRVYFNVQHPQGIASTCLPIFVSKTWTLGRIIDAVAEECKVPNMNNQQNAKKLRLFRKLSGDIVSTSLASKLEDLLLEENIIEGENLLLEYVDDCINLS